MGTQLSTIDKETLITAMSSIESKSDMSTNRPPKVLHPTLAFYNNWETPDKQVLLPGRKCTKFNAVAVMEDGVTTKVFSDTSFKCNYVVLFFFPMDRSVDYSELVAFRDHVKRLRNLDCEVLGVTSDSVVSIVKWIQMEPKQGGTGGPVNFPIISDKNLDLAEMFGVKGSTGMPPRATFVLDKERQVRHVSVYPRVVARSVVEVLRSVQAVVEVDKKKEEGNEVAIPAGWQPGDEVIINAYLGMKDYYNTREVEKMEELDVDVTDELKTSDS